MLVNVEVRLEAASFCVLETKTCGIQYLSLYLPSVCMSVRLAICLSICLGFCLSVFLSVCLVCLFVSLSACLFFCLSVCPSASFYPSHSFFKQSYSFVSCNRFYLSDLRLPVDDCLVLGKRLPIFFLQIPWVFIFCSILLINHRNVTTGEQISIWRGQRGVLIDSILVEDDPH